MNAGGLIGASVGPVPVEGVPTPGGVGRVVLEIHRPVGSVERRELTAAGIEKVWKALFGGKGKLIRRAHSDVRSHLGVIIYLLIAWA